MSKIAIIGLGYVGLPLAVALAEHHSIIGYDITAERIDQLRAGHDRTDEISPEQLSAANIEWSTEPAAMQGAEFFIVTVPTPVDEQNTPDLSAIWQHRAPSAPSFSRAPSSFTRARCGPA